MRSLQAKDTDKSNKWPFFLYGRLGGGRQSTKMGLGISGKKLPEEGADGEETRE